MTMALACTGRFATSLDRLLRGTALAAMLGAAVTAAGAEPPPAPPLPPLPAQAAHQVAEDEGLWSRLLPDEPSPARRLDPAIFTDLLPVSASEPAVRLPEDQQEADSSSDPAR